MKILLCHNYYQIRGGEDQCFEDELELLRQNGHEAIIYTRHNDLIDSSNQASVAMSMLWNRKSYNDVRKLMQDHRPDVMHCTNTFPLISPSVFFAAEAEKIPVVKSLHNFRHLCANSFLCRDGKVCEKCLKKKFAWPAIRHRCYRDSAAGSFAVSSFFAAHRLFGTWKKKVDVYYTLTEFAKSKLLHLGIDPDRLIVKPNSVQPDPGMGVGDGNFVVYVGRISQEKGIDALLDAWQDHQPGIELKVIGDGPLTEKVKQFAATNPLISYLGRKPLPEVLELMGRAAAVVLPSVNYETFGRTIVEGYATGTPAIASRLGGMKEILVDSETGYLVDPGNAQDIAEKVKLLIADEPKRQQMRIRARQEFEDKYTSQQNYENLMKIYELAIETAQHPSRSREEATANDAFGIANSTPPAETKSRYLQDSASH